MIAGDSRCEILRCLDPAGRGLNRVSWNRNWSPGPSGIRIEQVLTGEHLPCRIRRENTHLVHARSHGDGCTLRCNAGKLNVLRLLSPGNRNRLADRCEAKMLGDKPVFSGIQVLEHKLPLTIGLGLTTA